MPMTPESGSPCTGLNDSSAKPGFARKMLGEMDRIVVARQLGKSDDVFILDGLADRLAHADREVVEIIGLKRRLLR